MIDIHAHILPGVDDGPKHWSETLQLCQIASEVGISTMVATPHFIPGAYTRGVREGARLLKELEKGLEGEDIALEVFLAAEIEPFPEMIQWIEGDRLPLYPSRKHILIEAPMFSLPPWLEELLGDITASGLIPILAHPERSPMASTSLPGELVSTGGEIQLDAGSLLGFWGREAQKWAWKMVNNGWVSYVASDSHRAGIRDPRLLERAHKALVKEVGENLARDLTEGNPLKVITP